MHVPQFLLVLVFALVSTACAGAPAPSEPDANPSGETSVGVDDYDRTCTRDVDCVLVADGDQCAVCNCPEGALHEGERSTFDADAEAAAANCPPPESPAPACGACYEGEARCISGRCEFYNLSDPSQNDFGDAGVVDGGA